MGAQAHRAPPPPFISSSPVSASLYMTSQIAPALLRIGPPSLSALLTALTRSWIPYSVHIEPA